MADLNKDILNTLKMIEMHTKASAGASSKVIAQGRNDLGNETKKTSSDKITKSAEGLLATYKKLQKAIETEAKQREASSKIVATQNLKNRHANKALEDLRKSVERQIGERKAASNIHKSLSKELKQLEKMGVNLSTTFGAITNQNKGDFLKAIDNASDELNSLARTAKDLHREEESNLAKRQKMHEESIKKIRESFLKALSVSALNATIKAGKAAVDMGGTGFQFAGGVGGGAGLQGAFNTLGGVVDASVQAFSSGASLQELNAFAAANREALTAATIAINEAPTAMLTAQEGWSAVDKYGEQLSNTFGFRGTAQLQAVGQSLQTLTNLGIRPTMGNLENFGDGIERMTKLSNMTAGEIFSELSSLASDSDYQAFFLSMDLGTDAATYLSSSFESLQAAVGMNIQEFMAYQKFLAQQRKRTGSERIVQSAYIGRLASTLGMSAKDVALLQQGTAYRESLTGAEADRFDALYATLGERTTGARGEAARNRMTGRLQELDILAKGGGLMEQAGLLARGQSGVVAAQQAAQQERIDAAEEDTEVLVQASNEIAEAVSGLANSVLGGIGGLAASSFWVQMTSAIFAGNVAADKVDGGGPMGLIGGAAKWLGGVGLAGAIGYGLGTILESGIQDWGKWMTGDEDWSLGGAIADVSGAGQVSEDRRARNAREDQILKDQLTTAREYKENERKIAEAQLAGNDDVVKQLQETNKRLQEQYDEMTKERENILTSSPTGGRMKQSRKGN